MKPTVEAPANKDSRSFNECDIIGDFDRDEKGNVIVGDPDEKGQYFDKQGRLTNKRGYLLDPKTGDIINKIDGKKMFGKGELDEKGEVPAPFNFEKHNFNSQSVRGDFDFDQNDKPIILKDKSGNFVDK